MTGLDGTVLPLCENVKFLNYPDNCSFHLVFNFTHHSQAKKEPQDKSLELIIDNRSPSPQSTADVETGDANVATIHVRLETTAHGKQRRRCAHRQQFRRSRGGEVKRGISKQTLKRGG
ncbi:hypothetical protein HanPSC8_Chr11g0491151 [Helianthus annuus]|nr:hypothetical protein HanPSC8_Chr11g0491151 [Helianthus annuus]